MSNAFLLSTQAPDTAANFDALAQSPGLGIDQIEPSAFEGFGTALAQGTARGLSRVGEAASLAIAAPFILGDAIAGTGTQQQDQIFRNLTDPARRAVDFYAPDARTTGSASRLVAGLAEGLTPLLLGPTAGPVALIGTQGLSGGSDILAQGGSAAGAVATGTIRAASVAAGFGLPAAIGGTLAVRVASGAGINVAAGAGGRLAEAGALALTGDTKLSDAALAELAHPSTYVLDAALGAVFGGIAGPGAHPAQVDALLSTRNAEHFNERSAPGLPVDAPAAAAHQKALEDTLALLDEGRPVDLGADVGRAGFKPVEPSPDAAAAVRAAEEQAAVLTREGEAVEPAPERGTDPIGTTGVDNGTVADRSGPGRSGELDGSLADAAGARSGAGPAAGSAEGLAAVPAGATPVAVDRAGGQPAADLTAPAATRAAAPQPAELGPIAQAVREAVAAAGDKLIAAGVDEAGAVSYRKASDVLAEIDSEHAAATKEAEAYSAAINCYLGNGA